MTMPSLPHHNSGFTLLEAIVAMVLIATTGMALYGLINTNLSNFRRVQEHSLVAMATRNALEWMKQVNPASKPEGAVDSGDLHIAWNSTPVAPMIDGHGHPGNLSLFQIGLFDTQVTVSRGDREVTRFSLQQVGYRQVRQSQPTIL